MIDIVNSPRSNGLSIRQIFEVADAAKIAAGAGFVLEAANVGFVVYDAVQELNALDPNLSPNERAVEIARIEADIADAFGGAIGSSAGGAAGGAIATTLLLSLTPAAAFTVPGVAVIALSTIAGAQIGSDAGRLSRDLATFLQERNGSEPIVLDDIVEFISQNAAEYNLGHTQINALRANLAARDVVQNLDHYQAGDVAELQLDGSIKVTHQTTVNGQNQVTVIRQAFSDNPEILTVHTKNFDAGQNLNADAFNEVRIVVGGYTSPIINVANHTTNGTIGDGGFYDLTVSNLVSTVNANGTSGNIARVNITLPGGIGNPEANATVSLHLTNEIDTQDIGIGGIRRLEVFDENGNLDFNTGGAQSTNANSGFDFRFGKSIDELADNDLTLIDVDEDGNIRVVTAGELRDQVEYAANFNITEDQVVQGQIDGGEDLNGPELIITLPNGDVFNSDDFDQGRFASENNFDDIITGGTTAVVTGILPENVFDGLSSNELILITANLSDIQFNNIETIDLDFSLLDEVIQASIPDLPGLQFNDDFTQNITYFQENNLSDINSLHELQQFNQGVARAQPFLNFATGGGVSFSFPFPVVLDLNNNGIELDHLADAFFDFDGDGYQEQTTLASAEDGFLVIDLNADGTRGAGDGIINQAEEIAFSLYGEGIVTDLQALAEARDENGDLIFDTDGNNVLNANDAVWNELRVWQDRDGDGRTDEGELRTLNQAGITTIGLLYDSFAAYDDTSDDLSLFGNTLHGTASFVLNGETIEGGVGDVSLVTAEQGWREVETELGYIIEFETGSEISFAQLDGTGLSGINLDEYNLDGVTGDFRDNVLNAGDVNTAVILSGEGGNDSLVGGTSDDFLYGGDGADILFGGEGNDVLFIDDQDTEYTGAGGNDIIVVAIESAVSLDLIESQIEVVFGNIGNDTLNAVGINTDITLHGDEGNDVITGGNVGDILSGDEGNDILVGNSGDDLLIGGEGDDVIEAGDGDDRVFGGAGNDTLQGGYGNDVFIYSRGDGADTVLESGNIPDVDYPIAVTFSVFQEYFETVTSPRDNITTTQLRSGTITYQNVNIVIGLDANGVNIGGSAAFDWRTETITYNLGNGNVTMSPEDYRKNVLFNQDLVITDGEFERGTDGIYFVEDITISDLTFEQNGSDLKINIAAVDSSDSSDSLTLQNWQDEAAGIEFLSFSNGIDLLINHIDVVQNLSQNSFVDASNNNDQLVFGASTDLNLAFGSGNDVIIGGAGHDILIGGAGDDQLIGGDGIDKLYGGDGNDVLSAGTNSTGGFQNLFGGAGNDTYLIDSRDGHVFISANEGAGSGNDDRVVFVDLDLSDITSGAIDYASVNSAEGVGITFNWNDADGNPGQLIIGHGGQYIETFEFADGTSFSGMYLDEKGFARIIGNGDDNFIDGTSAHLDIIISGAGDDVISAGANSADGWQYLYGESGDDTYQIDSEDGAVALTVSADIEGSDTVRFTDLNLSDLSITAVDYTKGGTTADEWGVALEFVWDKGRLVIANRGRDIERYEFADGTTLGAINPDYFYILDSEHNAGSTTDLLYGTSGDDLIIGTDAAEWIYAGSGNDTLNIGSVGNADEQQFLFGEAGDDTYQISSDNGIVVITDVSEVSGGGNDTVQFTDLDLTDLEIAAIDYTNDGLVDHSFGVALQFLWEGGNLIIANGGEQIERYEFEDGSSLGYIRPDYFLEPGNSDGRKDDLLYGTFEDDLIVGTNNTDWIYGGAGNDTIDAGTSNNNLGQLLFGEAGNDTYLIAQSQGHVVITETDHSVDAGNDTIRFTDLTLDNLRIVSVDYTQGGTVEHEWNTALQFNWDSGNLLVGNLGERIETFEFSDGTIINNFELNGVIGSDLNDLFFGSDENENIYANGGDDILAGGGGDDLLHGGTGNDTLMSGSGADSLFGAEGTDTFSLSSGMGIEFIMDLEDDVDKIDISSYDFADITEALARSYDSAAGDGAWLNFGDGDLAFVANTTLSQLEDDLLL